MKVWILYNDEYQPQTLGVYGSLDAAETAGINLCRARKETQYDVAVIDGKRIHEEVFQYPEGIPLRWNDGKLEKFEPRMWKTELIEWQFVDYWIDDWEVTEG